MTDGVQGPEHDPTAAWRADAGGGAYEKKNWKLARNPKNIFKP